MDPEDRGGYARGRSRTDTLLRAADFLTTSAFAAPLPGRRVRSLEHAFTMALWALGARRLLSTPSPDCPGLGSASARGALGLRAFTEFDGLHRGNFSPRAQVVGLSPLRLPIPPLGPRVFLPRRFSRRARIIPRHGRGDRGWDLFIRVAAASREHPTPGAPAGGAVRPCNMRPCAARTLRMSCPPN
jgi:hypothetical protein